MTQYRATHVVGEASYNTVNERLMRRVPNWHLVETFDSSWFPDDAVPPVAWEPTEPEHERLVGLIRRVLAQDLIRLYGSSPYGPDNLAIGNLPNSNRILSLVIDRYSPASVVAYANPVDRLNRLGICRRTYTAPTRGDGSPEEATDDPFFDRLDESPDDEPEAIISDGPVIPVIDIDGRWNGIVHIEMEDEPEAVTFDTWNNVIHIVNGDQIPEPTSQELIDTLDRLVATRPNVASDWYSTMVTPTFFTTTTGNTTSSVPMWNSPPDPWRITDHYEPEENDDRT